MTLEEAIKLQIEAFYENEEDGFEEYNKSSNPVKYTKKYFDDKAEKYLKGKGRKNADD